MPVNGAEPEVIQVGREAARPSEDEVGLTAHRRIHKIAWGREKEVGGLIPCGQEIRPNRNRCPSQ